MDAGREAVSRVFPRSAAVPATAAATSIAAMCSATAVSTIGQDPPATISRAGVPARHSGSSAGTSIIPTLWKTETTKDQRASAPRCRASSAATNSAAARASSHSRCTPSTIAAATAGSAAVCPAAMCVSPREI